MYLKKVKLINHDCLLILMLLYIMLAYLMLFVCIMLLFFAIDFCKLSNLMRSHSHVNRDLVAVELLQYTNLL